jgi:hypothetical protein
MSVNGPRKESGLKLIWLELVGGGILEEANKPGKQGKRLKDLTPNFYQMMRRTHKARMQLVAGSCIQNCLHHGAYHIRHLGRQGSSMRVSCRLRM